MASQAGTRLWTKVAGALLLAGALFGVAGHVAQAAGVVGTGTPASCTDSAIQTAMNSGSGTITFNCGSASVTILMSTKVVSAGQNFVFEGGGRITLDGNSNVQLFLVLGDGALTLRNIALTRGEFGNGGAIWSDTASSVTLRHVTITSSRADGSSSGGAIYSQGTLLVEDSLLKENEATRHGGAIYAGPGATTTIRRSIIKSNQAFAPIGTNARGGAIYHEGGSLTIEESAIEGNSAEYGGGGVYIQAGTAAIVRTTLYNNFAGNRGGGIALNSGALTLSESLLRSNISSDKGGGLHVAGGTASLTNVTGYGNIAVGGGGLFSAGGATSLLNTTLYRNRANNGGGLWDFTGSTVTLKNTIIAASRDQGDNSDSNECDGPGIVSDGFNIFSDNSCTNAVSTDQFPVDPLLGPLQNNGGFTLTNYPQSGSPAIDKGTNSGCPSVDQRLLSRPRGAACDVGAVEAGSNVYLPVARRK
jgi:hypothetical protein